MRIDSIIKYSVCGVLGLCLLAGEARAHQPESVTLTYYPDDQTLIVETRHEVNDKYKHFIDQIDVRVNEGIEQSHYVHGQRNTKLSRQEIRVIAEEGDLIDVTVSCNIEGSLEVELLLVEENAGEHEDTEDVYQDASRRHFYRVLDDFRYHRHHDPLHRRKLKDRLPLSEEFQTPHDIQENPKRGRLESLDEGQQRAHDARFGILQNQTIP